MFREPFQALRAHRLHGPAAPSLPRLLIAGATGVLGYEVVRRLVGAQRFAGTQVLVREAMTTALRGVAGLQVPPGPPQGWPAAAADVAIVLFDPPRMFYGRERALWTPGPEQLVPLAQWLRRSGVATLAVVLPHAQGRLPEALKRGLAGLDEHAVATLGFERVLFIRSASKPGDVRHTGPLPRLAHWMLSITRLMVPASEQPVRAAKVAELLAAALQLAPPGIHVAAPELVWRAAQGDVRALARAWLHP